VVEKYQRLRLAISDADSTNIDGADNDQNNAIGSSEGTVSLSQMLQAIEETSDAAGLDNDMGESDDEQANKSDSVE
jgi:hypothetical protein